MYPSAALEPATLKIRGAVWMRALYGATALVPVLFWLVIGLTTGVWNLWLFWFQSLLWSITTALQFWLGIDLTSSDAVVHGLRRRRIPWAQIQAVSPERIMGGWRIVLWTTSGKRVPLRAPVIDAFGAGRRSFDRDYHVIGQWWLRHRAAAPAG